MTASTYRRSDFSKFDEGELERQRQAEIDKALKLKAQGLEPWQIASRLGCSVQKVRLLIRKAKAEA